MGFIRNTRAGLSFFFPSNFLSFLASFDGWPHTGIMVVHPWLPISLTHISALRHFSPIISAIVATFHPHHVDVGLDDPVDSSDSVTRARL